MRRKGPANYKEHPEGGSSNIEIFTEIKFTALGIVEKELGITLGEDATVVQQVGAINRKKGFSHIVISQENADSTVAKG
ncbi:MAG: hypothetical protein VB997_08610, partial [Opitutales bacterium]